MDSIQLIKSILTNLTALFNSSRITDEVFRSFVYDYFQLAINLGISEEEVLEAFLVKNRLNFERANTNY